MNEENPLVDLNDDLEVVEVKEKINREEIH